LNINVAGFQVLELGVQATDGNTANDYAAWGIAQLTPANVTDVTKLSLPAKWAWAPIKPGPKAPGGAGRSQRTTYQQGIGTTAGSSKIDVPLNGQYSTFTATIGLDSVIGSLGSVYFVVLGDGKVLYKSRLVTAATPAIPISINVNNVQDLTLNV